MNKMRLVWIAAFVVLFGSTSVVLLSSAPVGDRSDADALLERINEFWQCRIKGDYVTIYDLMSPDIQEIVSRPAFVGSKGFVNYYSYEIRALKIEGDRAKALIQYTWKANHPLFERNDPREHVMEDTWVRVDDRWYKQFVAPSMVRAPEESIDDEDLK